MDLLQNDNGKGAPGVKWAIGTAPVNDVGNLLVELEKRGAEIRFIVPVLIQTKVGLAPCQGFTVFARLVAPAPIASPT